jgi:hypothetical protein
VTSSATYTEIEGDPSRTTLDGTRLHYDRCLADQIQNDMRYIDGVPASECCGRASPLPESP